MHPSLALLLASLLGLEHEFHRMPEPGPGLDHVTGSVLVCAAGDRRHGAQQGLAAERARKGGGDAARSQELSRRIRSADRMRAAAMAFLDRVHRDPLPCSAPAIAYLTRCLRTLEEDDPADSCEGMTWDIFLGQIKAGDEPDWHVPARR